MQVAFLQKFGWSKRLTYNTQVLTRLTLYDQLIPEYPTNPNGSMLGHATKKFMAYMVFVWGLCDTTEYATYVEKICLYSSNIITIYVIMFRKT